MIEDNTHPLLFVVTDKDGALGQVSVPLETITLNRQRYEAPLRPHKKNNNPQGELSFSCWVSKYATLSPAITVKPEQKIQKGSSLSKLFTASPIFKRKEKQRHNNEMPPKRKNFSLSMLDVKYRGGDMNEGRSQSFDGNKRGHFYSQIDISASERMSPNVRARHSPKLDGDFPSRVRSNSQESCNSSSSGFVSHVDPTESSERIAQTLEVNTKDASLCLTKVPEETGAPEVTGISPKEGTTEGQTRLTIRGTNLGVNLPDVVGLYVCGSNCLSTIEYISANKLHCTTKAWRPGSGDIIIVTQSGGRGKCSVQFTFVEPPQENQPEAPPVDNTETLIAPPSPLSQKNVDGTELEEPMGYTSKRKIHPTIQVTSEPSSVSNKCIYRSIGRLDRDQVSKTILEDPYCLDNESLNDRSDQEIIFDSPHGLDDINSIKNPNNSGALDTDPVPNADIEDPRICIDQRSVNHLLPTISVHHAPMSYQESVSNSSCCGFESDQSENESLEDDCFLSSSISSIQAFEMKNCDGRYTIQRRHSILSISPDDYQVETPGKYISVPRNQCRRKMSLDPQMLVHVSTSTNMSLSVPSNDCRRHSLPPQAATAIKVSHVSIDIKIKLLFWMKPRATDNRKSDLNGEFWNP